MDGVFSRRREALFVAGALSWTVLVYGLVHLFAGPTALGTPMVLGVVLVHLAGFLPLVLYLYHGRHPADYAPLDDDASRRLLGRVPKLNHRLRAMGFTYAGSCRNRELPNDLFMSWTHDQEPIVCIAEPVVEEGMMTDAALHLRTILDDGTWLDTADALHRVDVPPDRLVHLQQVSTSREPEALVELHRHALIWLSAGGIQPVWPPVHELPARFSEIAMRIARHEGNRLWYEWHDVRESWRAARVGDLYRLPVDRQAEVLELTAQALEEQTEAEANANAQANRSARLAEQVQAASSAGTGAFAHDHPASA